MAIGAVCVLAVVALAAFVTWNARTGAIERAFIYFPERSLMATPADVGIAYEDVTLRAADGVRLHGWFVPGSQPVAVLWLHGNAGNIGTRVPWIRDLHRATGFAILIVDYRGYGRSEGTPSEAGLYRDAEAALAYLRAEPRVDPDRIVYFGRSLGSAVAVELAAREPPMALVIESPFPSLRWLADAVYPWLPLTRWLHDRYETERRARAVTAPALVIHGERDEIVPLEGAQRVADALASDVQLFVVPGAGHNDIPAVGGDAYYARLADFITGIAGPASR